MSGRESVDEGGVERMNQDIMSMSSSDDKAGASVSSAESIDAACSAYDAFADFYAEHWGAMLRDHALRAFDEILVPMLNRGHVASEPSADSEPLRIIDLCCGTGELAAALSVRGHDVLGLDGSSEMLVRARESDSGAEFGLADARTFTVDRPADVLMCMFDSLNHLGSFEELHAAFASIHAALRPGGLVLFDLNMRDGFEARFEGSFGFVEEDRSLLVRASFDHEEDTGRYELTLFRRTEGAKGNGPATWSRTDAVLEQLCFDEDHVRSALADAGFTAVSVYDAETALGMEGHIGRTVFVARRGG